MTRHRWLTVWGLPGFVVTISLLLAPTVNGAAFFWGLGASIVAVASARFYEVRHRRSRRQDASARPDPD